MEVSMNEFEDICEKMYIASGLERSQAEQAFVQVQHSPSFAERARTVLTGSASPYALAGAASGLNAIITHGRERLERDDLCGLAQFLVSVLQNRAHALERYNIALLASLTARCVKLGWSTERGRQVIAELEALVRASAPHAIIGMQILCDCVHELTTQSPAQAVIVHRADAKSFKDSALLGIVSQAVDVLRGIVQGSLSETNAAVLEALAAESIRTVSECLRFDFIGSLPDDQPTENPALQVPAEWRELIEDASTAQTLFTLVEWSVGLAQLSLACIAQLVAVRRSIFSNDATRLVFVEGLMHFLGRIMLNKPLLADRDVLTQVCRILFRFKQHYPLSEIGRAACYADWIAGVNAFTLEALQSDAATGTHAEHYLLRFWCRSCLSARQAAPPLPTQLESYSQQIVQAFVLSRLASVAAVLSSHGRMEDPLEDGELVREIVDEFPSLGRFAYEETAAFISQLFDSLLDQYRAAAQSGADAALVEGQLAWLTYQVAGLISGRLAVRKDDAHDYIDGELAVRAFQLLELNETVLSARGTEHANKHVDLALIMFLEKFRKAHIGDQGPSRSRAYEPLALALNLRDPNAVLDVMVTKICSNLTRWCDNDAILRESLGVFMVLAKATFTSLRLLAKLDSISYLLTNHATHDFGFMSAIRNKDHRREFYAVLGILALMDGNIDRFGSFMASFEAAFDDVSGHIQRADPAVMGSAAFHTALIGLFCDLTGIVSAARKSKQFETVFDWLQPSYLGLIQVIMQTFVSVRDVSQAILSFWLELVTNRSSRIMFDSSSPAGVLLFIETSKLLVTVGTFLLEHGGYEAAAPVNATDTAAAVLGTPGDVDDVRRDRYAALYEFVELVFSILKEALAGGYCCFGVFALYKDDSLTVALNYAMQLAVQLSVDELFSYPSLVQAYFAFLEILCHNHTDALVQMPSEVFVFVLATIQEGLQSYHRRAFTQSCASLDHLTAHLYALLTKPNLGHLLPAYQMHLGVAGELFGRILAVLLEVYMIDDGGKLPQWAVARPCLNLIVLFPEAFDALRAADLACKEPHAQAEAGASWDALLEGVELALSSASREAFARNLATFRKRLRDVSGPGALRRNGGLVASTS